MLLFWMTLSLSIAALYLIISLWLSRGLSKINSNNADLENDIDLPEISLLVAARNESENLPVLLDSLKQQSYPHDKLAIHIIDDRSEDETSDVIKKYQEEMTNLNLITITSVPEGIAPKKNAISQGVENSTGEIIVVTDADCIVKPQWLLNIASRFRDPNVGLVQGLTGYPKDRCKTVLDRFQRIDFFSHSVVAAAGIGKNLPINSNANNFSYRRSIFESLEGYGDVAKVVSGDDDLLLQRVWETGKWKIGYLATETASVVTIPERTFSGMLEQRKRWGSKTVYYKPQQIAVLASIFLFYVITFLTIVFSLINCSLWIIAITLLVVKIIGELFFLIPGTAIFNEKLMRVDILWASPLQLLLVLYSVFGGVLGSFSWKGRTYKRSL